MMSWCDISVLVFLFLFLFLFPERIADVVESSSNNAAKHVQPICTLRWAAVSCSAVLS